MPANQSSALKPWLPFKKQLELLESRGMIVEDRSAAEDYLRRVAYYRLSGYWYPLRRIDKRASIVKQAPVRLDEFEEGSRFEDVVRLYVFDKKLRLLALDALERIELAVRVDVAHLLGRQDPLAHRCEKYLDGRFTKNRAQGARRHAPTQHEVWLKRYNELEFRARREPFVTHHLERYGALPIWVAIELWDFGLLSRLFAGMRRRDRDEIARFYAVKNGRVFAQWLRSLNFIRNVSAHHSRLWNINVKELTDVPPDWPSALRKERPFFAFCLMQHLLMKISPSSSWHERFKLLLRDEFPSAFRLDDLGWYSQWEEWPLWAPTGSR